ncbi:uncharacterized protein METZ01_LOCUS360666, partial [marine metagenome]
TLKKTFAFLLDFLSSKTINNNVGNVIKFISIKL